MDLGGRGSSLVQPWIHQWLPVTEANSFKTCPFFKKIVQDSLVRTKNKTKNVLLQWVHFRKLPKARKKYCSRHPHEDGETPYPLTSKEF